MCQQCEKSHRDLTQMLKGWVAEGRWAKEGATWHSLEALLADHNQKQISVKPLPLFKRLWMSVVGYILGSRKEKTNE